MPEKLNKKFLQKHFGKEADISPRWLFDGFRVKTKRGGELLVSREKCTIVSGGDDMYQAVILMGNDLWGHVVAYGDHEQLAALVAHGEVCGVSVTVGGRNKWIFKERKRMAADVAFTFPRVHGNAHFATDDDLSKGGLL